MKLSKKARKGLSSLTGNRRAAAEAFWDLRAGTPNVRGPGKTKRLKGQYERLGYRQYDLPDGYRIQYRVADSDRTVFVDYVGPHP